MHERYQDTGLPGWEDSADVKAKQRLATVSTNPALYTPSCQLGISVALLPSKRL